jgi:hypothetical protein
MIGVSMWREMWTTLKAEKKWFLYPVLLALVIMVVLLVVARKAPVLQPFIYTIF